MYFLTDDTRLNRIGRMLNSTRRFTNYLGKVDHHAAPWIKDSLLIARQAQ